MEERDYSRIEKSLSNTVCEISQVDEEVINSLIPYYKDVLQKAHLQVFIGSSHKKVKTVTYCYGNDCSTQLKYTNKCYVLSDSFGISDHKCVMKWGMELNLSPINTRISKKWRFLYLMISLS